MTETIRERAQPDTKAALKAGERERVSALRLVADALQKDAKDGGDDEVAVLRRERKRRLEAAEAYRDGGSADRADAESGAESPGDMGKVMGALMPKVGGRADGKRVSAMVKDRLTT